MHKCMNWRAIDFDWNHAKAFLVTAEEGSLSAAAKVLNSTQPTIGRQVSALEESLNVVLFERVGRGLVLTDSGQDLLEHIRAMGVSANQVSWFASGHAESVAGVVRISASEIYAAMTLPALLIKMKSEYPQIQIELIASNEVSDLQRREADIAIRSFRPTEPELIAKKIKDVTGYFYATPDYLQKLGEVSDISDLQKADFISIGDVDRFIASLKERGVSIDKNQIMMQTDSHLVHWEMAKQGFGVGIVPSQIGDNEDGVQRLLPSQLNLTFSVWLTTHQELRTSKRIQIVFDYLAKHLVV